MKPLTSRRILIASGPTSAPLDDVRFITNRSTGRLGAVIARALSDAGADVVQLAGEASVTALDMGTVQDRIEVERFFTVDDLKNVLRARLTQERVDAVIMAAAVLDYIPIESTQGKHRSDLDEWTVTLRRGEKIIERIQEWAPQTVLVGFKLESRISLEALTDRAGDLLERANAKLVIANRIEEIGADKHVGYFVTRNELGEATLSEPLPTREAIAQGLVAWLARQFNSER